MRSRIAAALTFAAMFVLFFTVVPPPFLAHAQEAGALPDPSASEVVELVRRAHEAITNRHFFIAAGFALMLVAYAVRYLAARYQTKALSWALTDAGGLALTTVLSITGGLLHTAAAGKPITVDVALAMLETLLTAVASYTALRKGAGVKLPMPEPKAQPVVLPAVQ